MVSGISSDKSNNMDGFIESQVTVKKMMNIENIEERTKLPPTANHGSQPVSGHLEK